MSPITEMQFTMNLHHSVGCKGLEIPSPIVQPARDIGGVCPVMYIVHTELTIKVGVDLSSKVKCNECSLELKS